MPLRRANQSTRNDRGGGMIFFDIVFIPVLLLISVASFVHILWMLFVRPSPILRHYRIRIFLALFIAPVIGISVAIFFLEIFDALKGGLIAFEPQLFVRGFNLNMVGPFFLLAWIFACPTVWLILTLEKREFRPILFAGFWCGAVAWMALALSEGSLSFGLAMQPGIV